MDKLIKEQEELEKKLAEIKKLKLQEEEKERLKEEKRKKEEEEEEADINGLERYILFHIIKKIAPDKLTLFDDIEGFKHNKRYSSMYYDFISDIPFWNYYSKGTCEECGDEYCEDNFYCRECRRDFAYCGECESPHYCPNGCGVKVRFNND